MIQSMTGFGNQEVKVGSFGKISVELRSSNHKFLEMVFHLPEGFLSLEDKIKKEIEARIKRGRIACAINITGGKASGIFINKALLKNYILRLNNIKEQFRIRDEISMDTLIHLPGVLSLDENRAPQASLWPHLKILVKRALDGLIKTRQKEGRALFGYLKNRAENASIVATAIEQEFIEHPQHDPKGDIIPNYSFGVLAQYRRNAESIWY